MKCISILLLAAVGSMGQTGMAGIQGVVLDAQTQNPVPAALVMANRAGAPPFTRNTRSGADGAFQIQGLTSGSYSLCVQVPGDRYLDPCQWNGNPTNVTVAPGPSAAVVSLRLEPASILNLRVQDAQGLLTQITKDGRRPDLTLGVWGPRGIFYPAVALGAISSPGPQDGIRGYAYRLAVPCDVTLSLYISSHDLQLGDASGAALPANASQQSFQRRTGDPNPGSYSFSVLGRLP
jgi:hypothetical protein